MTDEGAGRYGCILRAVGETPWAILPAKLAVIVDLLAYRSAGARLTADEIRDRIGAAPPSLATARSAAGAIAVLPLFGVLAPRVDALQESSGAMSLERFGKMFREAMADEAVGTIVIDIDSPGGSVFGVEELADEIRAARATKRIIAIANPLAASAAYWIAAVAEEIVVSPSAEIGSIGVLAAHEDLSVLLETAGIKVTLISAGKFKAEGNPFEPLGEDALAAIQARVNDYFDTFVRTVAKGRGVSVRAVRSGFGEGRMVRSREAVDLGMADRVETLTQMLARLTKRPAAARASAAAIAAIVTNEETTQARRPSTAARRRRLALWD